MSDDFSQCMVSNSRMAARAITRRYDAYLRPFGVTSTQLSLLGSISAMHDRTVTEIAESRGFERTTLTRNLNLLEQMGLIVSRRAERGNGRVSSVTDKGQQLLRRLLPMWRQAQAELQRELGAGGFDAALGTLRRLSRV